MFDRKLIDYLPQVLQKIEEFAAICSAEQPEIEAAWNALGLVMDNQFIETATEAGVEVWEKEQGIVPLSTDTLEDRKKRLKTAWSIGVVYTYAYLVLWIKNACPEGTPQPVCDDYTLRVFLPVTVDYLQILADMRRNISANVIINPLIFLNKVNFANYTGAAFRCSVKQNIQTNEWETENLALLTDETGVVLTEGSENKVLYEEVDII